MFDLTIFPLSLETGKERYELPGLMVVSATRKAARMRAQDHLVLYCKLHTIAGSGAGGATDLASSAITTAQQREILTRLADTYFTFSGSITAGLRVVAARLNDFLLNRNLKAAQEGQTVGTLNMAVIHADRLVVAHAGATHSFLLGKNEVQHFDDGQAGRGLGLSRQMMPRFYQAGLNPGDLLLVCADPPSGWNEKSLASSPQLSFDHLRRRLTSGASVELQFGVVRFQTGKGQVSYWRPGDTGRTAVRPSAEGRQPARHGKSASTPTPTQEEILHQPEVQTQSATVETPVPGSLAEPGSIDQTILPELDSTEPERDHAFSYSIPEVQDDSGPSNVEGIEIPESNSAPPGPVTSEAQPGVFLAPASAEQMPGQEVPPSPHRPRPARPGSTNRAPEPVSHPAGRAALRAPRVKEAPAKPRQPSALKKGLQAAGRETRQVLKYAGLFLLKMSSGASKGLSRIIPRQYDPSGRAIPFFNLSPAQMLAIAILIPLVVVTVGTTVYVRSGLTEQYQQRLQRAREYVQQAEQLQDPVQKRESWKQAYALLLEANKLGESEEALALKQQIIKALDELEGHVRLDYQPANSSALPSEVRITRIVATLNDVYLLDASVGRILRLYRTSSSYELDTSFNCGAGQAGAIVINPLIDLAALPPNNEMHSTVMGIDAGGNLVYCAPNLTGFDSRPLALPDSGWGNITGITLYGSTLYVLDPKANAVYRYDGTNGVFAEPPHLYFDNTIPQMNDVIDLAVDQEFLYLLHADGRMTVCESSGFAFAATKCTDPAPYGDARPGYEPAPLAFAGTRFTHIQTTQPPDPSLFALDSANKSIYHLSLRRLNLQRQYRAVVDGNFPLPGEAATAFAIAPNRRVLIAFGSRLFFAAMP